MLGGKSPTWRDDIDALAFQPGDHQGACIVASFGRYCMRCHHRNNAWTFTSAIRTRLRLRRGLRCSAPALRARRTCVAAPNIDPFRRPPLTPVKQKIPERLPTLTAHSAGSSLGADWGSKATPIHIVPSPEILAP